MYHFVYKTTNTINGKFYIGKHSTKNIEDGYLGSGRSIRDAIIKYGKENFEKEIIGFCANVKEAYELEEQLLKPIWDKCICYNRSCGGQGTGSGENHPMWGRTQSDEAKKRISAANVGHRGFMLGKKHSEESKKKMSEIKIGKVFSESHKRNIGKGNTGKKRSPKFKKNIGNVHRGKILSKELIEKIAQGTRKTVYQYSKKTGNSICEFKSVRKAAKSIATNWHSAESGIGLCALGITKSAYGFFWSYELKENCFS